MSDRADASYRPALLLGGLIGVFLTASLIALLYVGWRLAGFSFVPFDTFDWLGRMLPGAFIEFIIGNTVAVIRALHLGPTAAVAKMVEQGIGIFNLLITGVISGIVLFAILRRSGDKYAFPLGALLGIVIGVPAIIISFVAGKTASVAPIFNAVMLFIAFLIWGMAFGWAYRRLNSSRVIQAASETAIVPDRAWAQRIDRRNFLIRLAGTTAVITVAGAFVGMRWSRLRGGQPHTPDQRWSATHSLPNADAAVMPAPGTRPEFTPLEDHYRIDINTFPPMIDGNDWQLKISGLVDQALTLTLDDLRRYETNDQFVTLSCISNPVGGDLIGTTRWTGISLQRLLSDWGVKPEATYIKIRSADEFYEVVSLADIRSDPRIMLTYQWDGVPLTTEHGYPLRIYIPDLHGMKQPKWIESIEFIDRWEPGYWVERDWDKTARMKATSVIDTVAVDSLIKTDGQTLVPIGGIAHAGARGISKVEIKIDDGPWVSAQLRDPLSPLTWVIWRYDWPYQPGRHTFTVRCYDGKGEMQISEPAEPYPSGASGLYSKTQKI